MVGQIYFGFTPVDDENHLWLITSHVEASGKDADAYRAKRAEYDRRVAEAPPVMEVVRDIWSGRRRYADVTHPDLAIVQDIAVQAGRAGSRLATTSGSVAPTRRSSSGARFSRASCALSQAAGRQALEAARRCRADARNLITM